MTMGLVAFCAAGFGIAIANANQTTSAVLFSSQDIESLRQAYGAGVEDFLYDVQGGMSLEDAAILHLPEADLSALRAGFESARNSVR